MRGAWLHGRLENRWNLGPLSEIKPTGRKIKLTLKTVSGRAVKTIARRVRTFSQPIIIIGALSSAVNARSSVLLEALVLFGRARRCRGGAAWSQVVVFISADTDFHRSDLEIMISESHLWICFRSGFYSRPGFYLCVFSLESLRSDQADSPHWATSCHSDLWCLPSSTALSALSPCLFSTH